MKDKNFDELKITGLRINYLHVCKRKLWLFDRGIRMEHTSNMVLLGSLLQDYYYQRKERKNILIDNLIQIDIIDNESIREVKYSNKLKEADEAQLLYYLYYLKRLGVSKKGILNYPKIKRREELILTEELEKEVEKDLEEAKKVLSLNKPPKVEKKTFCSKCAYFEFCWS
ncbi:CRISPR-associated protein Cas4 [Caldisericum exile]|uniref:CRISPR-associated exonuclease Cas4 n=1 Tax=Caldisericum exile (strain DSM 21853 / NBRC 104410 / AZM16c01) TaxID=511051 RepID=A0A7U6GDI9_CALEA|nr:CRISPR-associated protein Cas4 [Caldisericum exile]BAL80399.1 putative CRISPR-associated protein [Caldisericum exile AZM16c01]